MMALRQRDDGKVIVIVLKEILIGQDLQAMLEEARPGAKIVIGRSLGECVEKLPPGQGIDIAFVDVEPASYVISSLAQAVDNSQGLVIFVGQDRGSRRMAHASGNWSVLSYPFSEADVALLLADRRG